MALQKGGRRTKKKGRRRKREEVTRGRSPKTVTARETKTDGAGVSCSEIYF